MPLWLKIVLAIVVLFVVLVVWAYRRFARAVKGPSPDAQAIARRVLCLSAVHMRGEFEALVQVTMTTFKALGKGPPSPDLAAKQAEVAASINDWLRREALWDALSFEERARLDSSVGKWSDQDCRDATWRAESLAMLCWSLGLMEMLPADQMADSKMLTKLIPHRGVTGEFIAQAVLRPTEEINKARDLAELWHWRSRTTQLMKRPNPPKLPDGLTFQKIIALSCDKAREEGAFDPIGNDFPAKGKPYAMLSEEEYSEVTSIAMERHLALNWLCGYSANWDTVPTDT